MADKITQNADGTLNVPDEPIIPFIEGDGTGPDIWPRRSCVLDAAVDKVSGKRRSRGWRCSPARRRSTQTDNWLPDETVDGVPATYLVGIKGPLTTPVGGGIRSLNVALRQMLDLYVCLRPVRYFKGVPSPVKHPEKVDMVIFRENTEDIYAGIEWEAESPEAKKVLEFLQNEFGVQEDPLPGDSGIGIKPVSREGSKRLIRAALELRDQPQAQERHPGAQGQHHEVHRGRVPRLGLRLAESEFGRQGRRLGRLRRQAPATRSWSRTRSPTSRCSRCSRVPTSST